MFTVISRIFHFGFKNFSRNGWLSTATVAIMTLALIVFGGLILFSYVTQQAAASIENKIDISVSLISSCVPNYPHPVLPSSRFQKLSAQEQQLFSKYGKVPTHKNILMQKVRAGLRPWN